MNQQKEIDTKIGNAWKAHYAGQNDAAVEQFRALAQTAPDNVDVHWGLGLSYRNLGDKENALQSFQKVDELVTSILDTEPEDYERFFMLKRMVTQQIEQISDFLARLE